MPKSAIWVWALSAGLLNAVAAGAGDTAPAPRAVDDIWLPRPKPRGPNDKVDPIGVAPPNVFASLALVFPQRNRPVGSAERQETLGGAAQRQWPRLEGNAAVTIEPGDDPRRKLLKARLQQGVVEYRGHVLESRLHVVGPPWPFSELFECLAGLQTTVLDLWAGHPKELVPWLEELVSVAQNEERWARRRVEAGAIKPSQLNYVTRHRLKAEAALWKAQNPGARPAGDPPAKKGDPKGKAEPAGGDWLSDKKVPPTLFPGITLSARPDRDDPRWFEKVAEQFAKRCPRLSGAMGLQIEPGDGTLRRLLKARLHQGVLQIQSYRSGLGTAAPDPIDFSARCDCMDDICSTAVELWGHEPKELAPWLEELLIEAKDFERYIFLLAEAGALRPSNLNAISRHRLKVEAELWKVKNPK